MRKVDQDLDFMMTCFREVLEELGHKDSAGLSVPALGLVVPANAGSTLGNASLGASLVNSVEVLVTAHGGDPVLGRSPGRSVIVVDAKGEPSLLDLGIVGAGAVKSGINRGHNRGVGVEVPEEGLVEDDLLN